eukprot:1386651-Rhodomonas_salina.1
MSAPCSSQKRSRKQKGNPDLACSLKGVGAVVFAPGSTDHVSAEHNSADGRVLPRQLLLGWSLQQHLSEYAIQNLGVELNHHTLAFRWVA